MATPADRGGLRRAEAAEASRSETPTNGSELQEQSLKVRVGVASAHPTRRAGDTHRNAAQVATAAACKRERAAPAGGPSRRPPALVDRLSGRALGQLPLLRRVGPRLALGQALLGLQQPTHHQQLPIRSSRAWLAACRSGSLTALTRVARGPRHAPPGSSAAGPPSSPPSPSSPLPPSQSSSGSLLTTWSWRTILMTWWMRISFGGRGSVRPVLITLWHCAAHSLLTDGAHTPGRRSTRGWQVCRSGAQWWTGL